VSVGSEVRYGRRGLFIDGRELPAASGEVFAVHAPESEALIGHAARGNGDDVARAVAAARSALPSWRDAPPGAREAALLAGADALERRGDALLDLLIDESGSTVRKARGEIAYGATLLRTAAGEARRLYGETFPHDDGRRLSFVLREALGVVAVVSPFNAPLALFLKMCAFPLAAGNTVVAKPSEETPLIAVEVARLLHDAGLPAGVLNVVTGLGREAGEALTTHADVQGIAFTGSTATGVRIAAHGAATLKRLQLELGGKNALVVLADADLEEAAALAVEGGFAHAGQICMASSRVLVERPRARELAEAIARRAAALRLGDLRDEATAYGPLIHRAALAKVERHVEEAIARGATLLTGGAVARGLVYRPTVLWEPPRDAAIFREETFGPVVSVVEVAHLDDAVRVANDSPYGLSAGILTRDTARAFGAARRLRAGSVHIGSHSFHTGALAPIGGYGLSGIGRSGGKYSIDAFTELKWVSVAAAPAEPSVRR
jgi:aldehyde dehydrogenase (NAD+)